MTLVVELYANAGRLGLELTQGARKDIDGERWREAYMQFTGRARADGLHRACRFFGAIQDGARFVQE